MISAIARPYTPLASAPAQAPTSPAPAPFDGVDLSTIDTPVKAAVLPLLDPAVLGGLVAAAVVGSGSGHGSVSAHLETGTHALENNPLANQADVNFQVALSDHAQPISGGGTVGGRSDAFAITIDPAHNSAHYLGASGADDLVLASDSQGRVHVDGHLGTVNTHLTLSQVQQQKPYGTIMGIRSEGTLGDQAYTADTTFTVKSMDSGSGGQSVTAHIATLGMLGQSPVSKDYDLSASMGPGGGQLHASGHGSVAGVPTTLSVDAHVEVH